jgi:hypothetical protein
MLVGNNKEFLKTLKITIFALSRHKSNQTYWLFSNFYLTDLMVTNGFFCYSVCVPWFGSVTVNRINQLMQ